MALSGGGDRRLLRGLRPDGNIQHDQAGHRIVGNLKGDAFGLNIANPKPGLIFQYADEQSNRGSVLRARQRGWWVADPHRDGCPAGSLGPDGRSPTHTPMTSADNALFPGLVPLCTTEENFRRLQEERAAANRAQIDPDNETFLEGATRDSSGELTRFAMRGHSTTVMEGDHVVEQRTPDGVLREE